MHPIYNPVHRLINICTPTAPLRPSEATQAKRREESVRLRGRGQRGAARKEVMEERRERGGKAKAAKMAQRQKGRARRMEFKGR